VCNVLSILQHAVDATVREHRHANNSACAG